VFLNLGPGEVLVILILALLVLGPEKLPGAARQVGRALGELRRLSSGFSAELRDALQEPVDGTPRSATVPPPAPDPPDGDAGPA
jgi:Tat protein translocase TatB subunit